jgi:hypothetical protein
MKALTQADVIPFVEYERTRESFRNRIIKLKQRRRIAVGDQVTLVFENRDTIQFQVQEMIRAERIFDPAKIQEELDVYNALLPAPGELSATLLIEITESARIKEALEAFHGIDRGETVCLQAGPHTVHGSFEAGHSKEDKISAVHFVRFRPGPAFVAALGAGTPAFTVISHPRYLAKAPVPSEMREEWLADLTGAGCPAG